MRDPGGKLGEIVAHKLTELAQRLDGVALDDLRARAVPTQRDFAAALARPGARFVMEVKRASPSRGAIAEGMDPVEAATAYLGAADCISVLTDAKYFGGSLDVLAQVRAAVDVPLLCKDFMVDLRQVAEARIHGADAILVMLSVLEDHEARAMMDEAARFGMAALVEVHDEAEMARASQLGAALIGINNRDLRSLTTDLAVTERLAPLAPANAILISESGIADRADVLRLAHLSDGFLVGSSLMASGDLRAAARALAFGRVKICGLTRTQDVAAARDSGASFGGLIFVPSSPRAVTPEAAQVLAAEARKDGGLKLAGVFRDAAAEDVAAAALGLAAVQLHGVEDAEYIAALRALLPAGVEIWKAVAVDAETGRLAHAPDGADRILFDTAVSGASGGTGRAFDWRSLAGHPALPRAILAGGVTPENAAAAQATGAWAIDVNSGVESAPGVKSGEKLAALFAALRAPRRAAKGPGAPRRDERKSR
jgi:indole-3-glycerol phosphate synthase/phosphoribosylanthranilate isomerase